MKTETAEAHLRVLGFQKYASPIDCLLIYRNTKLQGVAYDTTNNWQAMDTDLLPLARTLNAMQKRLSPP